jgi:adenylate kinase family enzyme
MSRRILVKGGSGAGKSTLARELASRLEVPLVELDALHWGPKWTAATAGELRDRVQAALDDSRGWVVDGNYEAKLGTVVLDRGDLIVWLDLPLRQKLGRLVVRTARRWARSEELWNGNRETLKGMWGVDSLFSWAVRTHFRHRTSLPQQLDGRAVVRLRTAREAAEWMAGFSDASSR